MTRSIRALALCLVALSFAARGNPIAAPDDWRKQSFDFPLPFAASIPYSGTEHVRFSPEWANFSSEAGFSYVVLWDIKRTPMEGAHLERALAVYFDSLMENAARARKLEELPVHAAVVLHPMRAPNGWKDAYAGVVHTWNGFGKGEDLRLEIEIAQRPCGAERMHVFFALSRAKRTDAAWRPLRAIRADTPC
jgi:hypothetical protein